MTPDTARTIAIGTVGVVCAAILIAVQFTAHDPGPATATPMATTVTTPIPPRRHPNFQPWPSLD